MFTLSLHFIFIMFHFNNYHTRHSFDIGKKAFQYEAIPIKLLPCTSIGGFTVTLSKHPS